MRPLHLCLTLLALTTATPAMAQLQLPGAVGPGGGGGGGGGGASPDRGDSAVAAGVAVRAPAESTILGRELRLNGARGRLSFEKRGADLVVTRLTLAGEKISRHGEACSVDVAEGPFTATPKGRMEGLRRYEVNIPSCTFTMEVLDGAVQAHVGAASASSPLAGYCEFKQADCKGFMAGVWGPASSSIGPTEIKAIERTRAAAEKNARANYRALLAAAGRDRDKVRLVASEQAGFSSSRSERCYDYQGEDRHGFCSSRVTEAWAIALRARLNPEAFLKEDDAKPAARRPPRRTPPPPAPAAPAPAPAQ